VIGLGALACSAGVDEPPALLNVQTEGFNPSPLPGSGSGHVAITQKAIELLRQHNLLPPMLDASVSGDANKNIALLTYGNNFADHPDVGWPNLDDLTKPPSAPVPNRMTAWIPSSGSLRYASASSNYRFQVHSAEWNGIPIFTTAAIDVSVDMHWGKGPSAALLLDGYINVSADAAVLDFPGFHPGDQSTGQGLNFTVDNLYHYAYGDLRDLNDPTIVSGDTRLRMYPLLPEHIATDNTEVRETIIAQLENQSLLAGSDYGSTKYGAILYQIARRFFVNSVAPAPNLADLVHVGNDVPGWHTGWMQGHGSQKSLKLDYPHTYLGGMPYVCTMKTIFPNADPCSVGTPTWPPWIIEGNAPPTDLRKLEEASPPRSDRAALIYLGWATHMIQDASLPHHVAGWTGREHEAQDGYGDHAWYYKDYSEYAGKTVTTTYCHQLCSGSGCTPVCLPVTTPHPLAEYARYKEWLVDPYMQAEADSVFGSIGARKTRSEICESLGLNDAPPRAGGLDWEAVHPVYLGNARRAYQQRQPVIRGDDALAAGREYVKNAVMGTAKLLLCAIPNGPSIPAAPAPDAARVFEDAGNGGHGQFVAPGLYDATWPGPHNLRSVGDNAISSIWLPPGYTITLFDQAGGMGASQMFTGGGDTSSFNDVTSSLFVTKAGETGTFFIKLRRDFSDSSAPRQFGMERYLTIVGDGTSADQWTKATSSGFSGELGQQWRYSPNNRQLINGDGLCLDIPGAVSTSGTGLEVYPCHGDTNQQWQFTASGQILNPNGKCLSALSNGQAEVAPGVVATISECNVPDAQQWDILYTCSHDPCVAGRALLPSCSPDVADVCSSDPFCCSTYWDQLCTSELMPKCQ